MLQSSITMTYSTSPSHDCVAAMPSSSSILHRVLASIARIAAESSAPMLLVLLSIVQPPSLLLALDSPKRVEEMESIYLRRYSGSTRRSPMPVPIQHDQ